MVGVCRVIKGGVGDRNALFDESSCRLCREIKYSHTLITTRLSLLSEPETFCPRSRTCRRSGVRKGFRMFLSDSEHPAYVRLQA